MSNNLITTDTDLALYLRREAGVAVVPGSTFELLGHFRISYAPSDEELREAMRRIGATCSLLRCEAASNCPYPRRIPEIAR